MSSTKLRILAACLFTGIALLRAGSMADAAKPAPSTPLPFRYRVVYLGTLPGATTSVAKDINSWGDVVGESGSAYLYRSATDEMLDLNSVVDSALNLRLYYADAINDNGQIGGSGNEVGVAGSQFIYRLTPPAAPEEAWSLERAPLPGGGDVCGINADGDLLFIGDSQCFIWPAEAEMPVTLGPLEGRAYNVARGISGRNASGVVHFAADGTATQPSAKFAYQIGADPSTLQATSIGSFGGITSPLAIDAAGNMVGSAAIAARRNSTTWHAFFQAVGSSTLSDLGTLGGEDSEATAINSVGDIIGMAETAQSTWGGGNYATRFIRTGGKMYDLEKMVDRDSNGNLPSDLRFISQINASKVICGPGYLLVPYTP